MIVTVKQVELKETNKYPYTHRVELEPKNLIQLEEIIDWININEIKCSIIPNQSRSTIVVYTTKEDAAVIKLSLS